MKLASYSEDWFGHEVDVVEMDGAVDKLEEIIYLESQVRTPAFNNPHRTFTLASTLHTLTPPPSTLHPPPSSTPHSHP